MPCFHAAGLSQPQQQLFELTAQGAVEVVYPTRIQLAVLGWCGELSQPHELVNLLYVPHQHLTEVAGLVLVGHHCHDLMMGGGR